MKTHIVLVSAALISTVALAQLKPANLEGFQTLVMSPSPNPLRDCGDAGLGKLYIMRIAQVTRKTDLAVNQTVLTGASNDRDRVQLDLEHEIWAKTHLPARVATSKFDYCQAAVGLPTTPGMSHLAEQCFGNAMLAIDTMQAKQLGRQKEQVKADLLLAKSVPLSPGQAGQFVDEMYAAMSQGEENALARALFSSCIQANNGRF